MIRLVASASLFFFFFFLDILFPLPLVLPPSSLVIMADIDSISVTIPASQDPAFDTRGEHEASDVVDQDPSVHVEPEILQDNAESQHRLDEIVEDVDGDLHEAQENIPPASTADVSKKPDVPSKGTTPTTKDKSTVLAKSAFGKVNSSALTDKKVR